MGLTRILLGNDFGVHFALLPPNWDTLFLLVSDTDANDGGASRGREKTGGGSVLCVGCDVGGGLVGGG